LDFKQNLIVSVTELLWKTPVCLVMSLLLALLANRKSIATPFLRSVFFLPVIFTSGVVLSTIQKDSVASLMMSGTVISSTGQLENHGMPERKFTGYTDISGHYAEEIINTLAQYGIRTEDDFYDILRAGADKISVNSAAVRNPDLISKAARRFGSQCVVLAIDARRARGGHFEVVLNGGRVATELDAIEWAIRAEKLGAGEIMLNSIDADGTKNGFDLEMTKAISEAVGIPVIASGGCGKLEHFAPVFNDAGADAALAASVFHFGELSIRQVKDELRRNNIPVR